MKKTILFFILLSTLVLIGCEGKVLPENAEVCCESFGFGSEMKKCCETYEFTTIEDCKVEKDFVGGGKRVVEIKSCLEKKIGGERDEHGCLGAAGYTWNEDVGACIREWELDEEQRKAAKFVVMVQSTATNTISKVDSLDCEGCFIVYLQRGNSDEVTPINLKNWKITHNDS